MSTLLVVGTTGLVGTALRQQALNEPRVSRLIAISRRPLEPAPKLENHVHDFDDLPADAPWWAADAVISTLGSTRSNAGSSQAFRHIDHDLPLAVAQHARAAGTLAFVLNSATGASPNSPILYSRTKGELERDLRDCGFPSLTFVRPALIGGKRDEHRPLEGLAQRMFGQLDNVLPQRVRMNPAEQVAAALLEAALLARPGVHTVESSQLTA